MTTHHLWGTDGGHIGSITVEPNGGREMAIVQISVTLCAWKNFDYWWHEVYGRVRDMVDAKAEPPATTDRK